MTAGGPCHPCHSLRDVVVMQYFFRQARKQDSLCKARNGLCFAVVLLEILNENKLWKKIDKIISRYEVFPWSILFILFTLRPLNEVLLFGIFQENPVLTDFNNGFSL